MDVNRKRKRGTLDDFFINKNSSKDIAKDTIQDETNNHTKLEGLIPGLRVLEEFVTKEEEQHLLDFLDHQEWRKDLARRVIHYGGTYCLMPPRTAGPEERQRIESTILRAPPIPAELHFVISRMIGQQLYTRASMPEFCIVNEYKEAQGISAHVENFCFKSPVCGLTLGRGDYMRFHELASPDDGSVRSGKASQAKRTGRRIDVWMSRQSLLVMTGEAREKWQHEIPRSKKNRSGRDWKRVSLTFRTDKE